MSSLVNIGGVILSKRILESPSFKTNLALALKTLSQSTQSTLRKYITEGKVIPKDLREPFRRIINQTINQSLSNN
jgi:hypothetical protein